MSGLENTVHLGYRTNLQYFREPRTQRPRENYGSRRCALLNKGSFIAMYRLLTGDHATTPSSLVPSRNSDVLPLLFTGCEL
ncbi:hypothetical protein MHYP_G00036230 [Metynnis hypsauchen]